MCCRTIDSFQEFEVDNMSALKTVIQEMKKHKRVMDHINNLRAALNSPLINDWEHIREKFDCGDDQEEFFTYLVESGFGQDFLRKSVLLDSEKVEEVVKAIKFLKFFYQKTPEKFRQSLFGIFDSNTGGFTFLFRNSLENFKERPELYNLANDFIQEVDNDLNEYASKKLIEEQAREDAEHNIQKEIETADNKTLEKNDASLPGNKKEDTVDATATPVNSSNTSSAPTAGDKTPEKNDTTFWSEHKGKIALGVAVVCTAGAVAAYVLAYSAVALALAVLAAVILMGAGIAKVCEKVEDPSVEGLSTSKEQGA